MVEGRNAFDRERAPALAGRLERITVNLPAGFDPRRHTPAVIQKITESHGPGWEVEAIDPSGKRLTAVRQVEITEAHHADADTMILGLAQGRSEERRVGKEGRNGGRADESAKERGQG